MSEIFCDYLHFIYKIWDLIHWTHLWNEYIWITVWCTQPLFEHLKDFSIHSRRPCACLCAGIISNIQPLKWQALFWGTITWCQPNVGDSKKALSEWYYCCLALLSRWTGMPMDFTGMEHSLFDLDGCTWMYLNGCTHRELYPQYM